MGRGAFFLGVLVGFLGLGFGGRAQEVRHMTTDGGVEFGLWGGNGEKSPAPLLFILGSTIDETLGSPYFRQCGNRLAADYGWLCVSLDLPYHGTLRKKKELEPLDGWADGAKKGEDFVSENNKRMKEILDYLILKGYADPKKIHVCGTSRGGYLSLQFAAVEPRVRAVAAFAPVTDLLALREFKGMLKTQLPVSMDLDKKVDAVSGKRVWMVIGDKDERVGTDLAVQFAKKLSDAAIAGNRDGQVEMHVMVSKGHTTPEGADEMAVGWFLKMEK